MPDFLFFELRMPTLHEMNMLASFLKHIEVERGYSSHTVRSYGDDIRQFLNFYQPEASEVDFSQITHRHIRAWVVFLMSEGISERSINRKLSSLRTFFRYLKNQGAISSNPIVKVVPPKAGKRLPEFVPESDMEKLEADNLFPASFEGIRDNLIILLLYYSGIRLSELVGLSLSSIDTNSQTMKVLGKGNKERVVPLHPDIKPLIQRYIAARQEVVADGCSAFFITCKGKPIYPKLAYRVVNRYLSMVTPLQKRSPHVLRHTFATHLLNQGAELNAIKELLGHSNLLATQVYTHNTFEKLKRNYNQAHPRA